MTVRIFVSGSAAVLAAWLGVTFFRDVPSDHYPALGNTTAAVEPAELPEELPAEEMTAQVAQTPPR